MAHRLVTLAFVVKDLRNYLGMNQVEFARYVGISRACAARLEKPCANPRLKTLFKLAKAGMDWSVSTKEHAMTCDDPRHLGLKDERIGGTTAGGEG
jgi:DNA-binding XRE family transcriptional regulator